MTQQFTSVGNTEYRIHQDLQDMDKRPLSPLRSIALGPGWIVWSALDFSPNGVSLERHRYLPGERRSALIDQHVISLSHNAPARLEYRAASGEFVSSTTRPRSMMISPKGLVPEMRLHMPAEFSHCAIDHEFLRLVASEIDRPVVTPKFNPGLQDKSMLRILSVLADELGAKRPTSRVYVDSLVYALAVRYLLFDVDHPDKPKSRVNALPPRILNRIRSKVEANLDCNFSLESLAAESGYSRAHFLRMFQAATGLTPHQYIMDLRLKRAQERLKQVNSSIVDVALSCGFSSQSHMTSVFRRELDITPGEFRRQAGS